jgi:hypothetical protein
MRASEFIGGGAGPLDLSGTYKTYLTGALDEKYPPQINEPPAKPRKTR